MQAARRSASAAWSRASRSINCFRVSQCGTMSVSRRSRVFTENSIPRCWATLPSALLLDEPTAGMSPSERQDTIRLLKSIAAGVTIVIVEHDMDVVFGLADRITVLFNGRKIADGTTDAIKANAEVRAAYLGNPVQQ